MQIIRPNEFARAFAKAVEVRSSQINRIWSNWSAKEYSKLFLDNGKSVLKDVATSFHLHFQGPWWTLDGIIYEEVDDQEFPGDWQMAKYLSVAIEHENNPGRAAYQMNKLSIFSAPLKVLITYPGRPSKRFPYKSEAVLKRCARVTHGADILEDFSSRRKQMIILGDDDPTDENPSGFVNWRYYVYEHGQFAEMKVEP